MRKRQIRASASGVEEEKVQHSPGGIKGRWVINILSIVGAILSAVVIIVAMATTNYYYSSLRENVSNRASTTANFFNKFLNRNYDQFYSSAENYISEFTDKDKLELQILDETGRVIMSSSGFTSGSIPSTGDVEISLNEQKTDIWTGIDVLSGERVMSVTSPLYSRGSIIGGVRYVTSLEVAERQIAILILGTVLAGLVFLAFVVISNIYFLKSIVDPVMKINTIAKEIAAGRYGMRLHKIYDDEIGQLCDTINYMSDEIGRAEKMKNDFISSVSHELRTPLTAIGGWSETLIAGNAEEQEEVMQGLHIIQKESKRLTQMVEELLDFTRMESGGLKLNMETFDVANELYEAIYMYSNLLEKEGMTIEYTPIESNSFIVGDRHRIKQVFLNIIDNAAKYGKNGKKIEVVGTVNEERIIVKVKDYGVGIPEKELPFVKDKFFKGSSKQRGSGIGLAVTDEIVKMHGGILTIDSQVGEGTEVTIELPSYDIHGTVEVPNEE